MLVLDCSAAVHIARQTEEGKQLESMLNPQEEIISTTLLFPETSNVLWKYASAGEMDVDEAMQRAHEAVALVDRFYDEDEYFSEALSEACRHNHPTYDFYYLLLAKRTGSKLMSCDKRLNELAEELGVSLIQESA